MITMKNRIFEVKVVSYAIVDSLYGTFRVWENGGLEKWSEDETAGEYVNDWFPISHDDRDGFQDVIDAGKFALTKG